MQCVISWYISEGLNTRYVVYFDLFSLIVPPHSTTSLFHERMWCGSIESSASVYCDTCSGLSISVDSIITLRSVAGALSKISCTYFSRSLLNLNEMKYSLFF